MKIDSILLFEPERVDDFYPFSVMHPLWELRCGMSAINEKFGYIFPKAEILYHCGENKLHSFLERHNISDQSTSKAGTLVWDASILPTKDLLNEISSVYSLYIKSEVEKTVLFTSASRPFAAYIPAGEMVNPSERNLSFLPRFLTDFMQTIPSLEIQRIRRIGNLWNTLDLLEYSINDDFVLLENIMKRFIPEEFSGVHATKPDRVLLGNNVSIAPGVVIDNDSGPVIIGDNAKIMPNAVIIGPSSIGNNSTIKAGAKIYEETAIGPWCKVGGEVEASVFQAYSNKQHDGFLGHSYICEWVNLGADTNTSDLKNTYGNILIKIRGKAINTEQMFLGMLCGDHTKTAINTQLNSGTVAGVCGMIAQSGFPDKEIPSFSWLTDRGVARYDFAKAIEVARRVMRRRNRTMTDTEEIILRDEYNRAQ
jgi:UDP-N-acetylglucosamine diphosphorylase/glucosamine-1-phosphate N-acetyltransferase